MSKRLILLTILVAVTAALAYGLVLLAQTATPPGKYIPRTEWEKELKPSKPQTETTILGDAHGVPHLLIQRRLEPTEGPPGFHKDLTEIFQILDGSATYVTGGSMPDPKDPNYRTVGIKGGKSHDVKAGDFIVIPPGTPHWFRKINGHITFVQVRFPGNVTAKK